MQGCTCVLKIVQTDGGETVTDWWLMQQPKGLLVHHLQIRCGSNRLGAGFHAIFAITSMVQRLHYSVFETGHFGLKQAILV